MKIVYDRAIPYIKSFFNQPVEVLALPSDEINSKNLRDADVLFVRTVTKVNKSLLDNTSVRFVGSATAGFDHLDTEYLDKANIAWSYAPGCNAKAVADYVVFSVAHLMQAGVLKKSGNRAGVIGIGHVGQQVVNALKRLDFDVVLNDPPRADNETDFVSTPLDQFYDLDLICLHTPLTKTGPHSSFHLLDSNFFSNFNSKGIILNAGRGDCIDLDALKKSTCIKVLDVWNDEPNVDLELMQSAFIATPHIAGYSEAAKYRASKQIYQSYYNHFEIEQDIVVEEDPSEYVAIDLAQPDWIEQLLQVENLIRLSELFKRTLQKNSNNIANSFKNLREQYILRREILLS